MTLTPDQQEALDLMLELPPTFILKGYAGTGKTYLLDSFIDEVCKSSDRPIVTAPTHKALSVASGDCTIHSYLGLRLKEDKDKQILVPECRNKCQHGQTVIIDEASMVSEEIMEYLLDAQERYNLNLIFVGDPGQLPPVGDEVSPVWKLELAETFTLTKIMRQAAENPIIALATEVRNGNMSKDIIKDIADDDRIKIGSIAKAQQYFIEHIEDLPQIISFKNVTVDSLNIWARRQVMDSPKDPILPGEEMYIRSTYEKAPHRLEDIVTISEIEDVIPHPMMYIPLRYNMEVGVIKTEQGSRFLTPWKNSDLKAFDANLKDLTVKARQNKSWGKFWELKNSVILLKHKYAMTCHRSQGSTFGTTIVNRAELQTKELFYTALTRAADKTFIIL